MSLLTPLNVNCHASDGRKSTPLHLAAGYNRTRIVQLLLQHGADVHAKVPVVYLVMTLKVFTGPKKIRNVALIYWKRKIMIRTSRYNSVSDFFFLMPTQIRIRIRLLPVP
jgi:ankyrin repeat protein